MHHSKLGCSMSQLGQTRSFGDVGSMSGLPESGRIALLAALSLFCAGVAWILDHLVLGSVFFALGLVAALGIVWQQ